MTLTLNLPSELEAKLAAEAAKQGVTVSEHLRRVVEGLFPQEVEPEAAFVHPLVRLAEEARTLIPPEERRVLPADGARNYKH